MYYYIIDPQKISQKEFERVQNSLYSSLSEYRISGEVVRITGLRTISQLVENAFAHEAKTIVAVGSDQTLHEVINAVRKREMVVGFIPLMDSELGNSFGIKDLEQAVKTIAFRRIEEIDLGEINGNYFLSKISFGTTQDEIKLIFKADEKYQATQDITAGLVVDRNLTDGVLDILLLPKLGTWNSILYRRTISSGNYENIKQSSVLHVKTLEILQPEELPILLNGKIITRTPAKITINPKMLRMIVGRERAF